jgi:hypothetical protein
MNLPQPADLLMPTASGQDLTGRFGLISIEPKDEFVAKSSKWLDDAQGD